MKQVAIAVLAIIGMVAADTEQAADPYADFYKHYYETNAAQEKSHPHHSSDRVSGLATPETAVRKINFLRTKFHIFVQVRSIATYKIISIFPSSLQLVVGAAGLAAGLLGIAAYVNQQNELKSICTTVSRPNLVIFGEVYIIF